MLNCSYSFSWYLIENTMPQFWNHFSGLMGTSQRTWPVKVIMANNSKGPWMHVRLAFLSDIKQSQNVLINFIRNPKQNISRKSVWWKFPCSLHTKTQLNRHDNTTTHFMQKFCETAPDRFSGISKCMLQSEAVFI
jgi:hypothetical protein